MHCCNGGPIYRRGECNPLLFMYPLILEYRIAWYVPEWHPTVCRPSPRLNSPHPPKNVSLMTCICLTNSSEAGRLLPVHRGRLKPFCSGNCEWFSLNGIVNQPKINNSLRKVFVPTFHRLFLGLCITFVQSFVKLWNKHFIWITTEPFACTLYLGKVTIWILMLYYSIIIVMKNGSQFFLQLPIAPLPLRKTSSCCLAKDS